MMVGIDETRGDDLVGAVNHIAPGGSREGWANLGDATVLDEDIGVSGLDLVIMAVGEDDASLEKKRGHCDYYYRMFRGVMSTKDVARYPYYQHPAMGIYILARRTTRMA